MYRNEVIFDFNLLLVGIHRLLDIFLISLLGRYILANQMLHLSLLLFQMLSMHLMIILNILKILIKLLGYLLKLPYSD